MLAFAQTSTKEVVWVRGSEGMMAGVGGDDEWNKHPAPRCHIAVLPQPRHRVLAGGDAKVSSLPSTTIESNLLGYQPIVAHRLCEVESHSVVGEDAA